MRKSDRPHPSLVLFSLLSIQVLFGINYVVSKKVVDAFPPLVWASTRLVISTLLMVIMALALRRPHPKPDRRFFLPLILFSLLGMIINQSAFLVGLHFTTPSNSAILNTLTPIFTLLIVTIRGQERMDWRKVLGFGCAFIGVLVLRRVEEFSFSDQTAVGDLLIIVNCLSFSFFITFSKKFVEKYDQFWVTTWMFLYGSIGLTMMAIPDWIHFQMPAMTDTLWWCVLFAILGGTLLTYFLNNWTLKHANSSHVALFIYVQPVITMLLSFFWLGEQVSSRTILSCFTIFIGVLLAISTRARTQVAQRAP